MEAHPGQTKGRNFPRWKQVARLLEPQFIHSQLATLLNTSKNGISDESSEYEPLWMASRP
jgi:hypothetical protein